MAPEYLIGQFSKKSDVFSFGVLILEIVSGQKISSIQHGEETGYLCHIVSRNFVTFMLFGVGSMKFEKLT